MIGWIGLGILLLSYATLIFDKSSKSFKLLNILASTFLVIHAINIHDSVFAILNSFIIFILIISFFDFKRGEKNETT
jgi:lipid-A-disaccharide synthase-like uncharacterized protein